MDITSLPRELLFKNRKELEEFGIHIKENLNSIIFRKIAFIILESNEWSYSKKDYIDMFNDAHYFCILVNLDKDPAGHIRDIIEAVFKNYKRKTTDFDIYKKIVLTIARAYLSTAFKNESGIIPIKKYLNDKTFYVHGLFNKVEKGVKISIDEFKPRLITSDVVSGLSWPEITENFKLKNVHFCVQQLGVSNEEKLEIVKIIYKSLYLSDSIYNVSYEVDRYLKDKYREYGGGELNEVIQKDVKKPLYYKSFVTKLCDYHEIKEEDFYYKILNKALKEYYSIDADKQKLNYQNLDLINENKSLQLSLTEFQEKYRQLESKYESHLAEQSSKKSEKDEYDKLKKREAEMNAKVDEMNRVIQDLQNKLGTETVPISVIVEGIKRKARIAGIVAANNLFEQVDIILYNVETWRNNRIELMSFFEDLVRPAPQVKVEVQTGGIAQITEKEIINGRQMPNKLIE